MTTKTKTRLYRSETDRVFAGVAGGLGEILNIDPTIIRIAFLIMAFFGGGGLVIYVIIWLLSPNESQVKVGKKTSKTKVQKDTRTWVGDFTEYLILGNYGL